MGPEDNQQRLATVRDAVTMARYDTDIVRLAARGLVVTGFLALVLQRWSGATVAGLIRGPVTLLGFVGFTFTLGAWLSPLVALPLAAAYRRWRRVRIRRRLEGIPPEQLAAVLLPLRDHPLSDRTRRVIRRCKHKLDGSLSFS